MSGVPSLPVLLLTWVASPVLIHAILFSANQTSIFSPPLSVIPFLALSSHIVECALMSPNRMSYSLFGQRSGLKLFSSTDVDVGGGTYIFVSLSLVLLERGTSIEFHSVNLSGSFLISMLTSLYGMSLRMLISSHPPLFFSLPIS